MNKEQTICIILGIVIFLSLKISLAVVSSNKLPVGLQFVIKTLCGISMVGSALIILSLILK